MVMKSLVVLAYGFIWMTSLGSPSQSIAKELTGNIDFDDGWGSSWIDLSSFQDFSVGDTLRITLENRSAKCVLVRLLGSNDDAKRRVGVVGGVRTVGEDRMVVVQLSIDRKSVKQISVHGDTPWGQTICPGNGPTRIESIDYVPAVR
jgi:hypothetical protein